jgi:RNA polymerase sigma factor (TIGR02999 family)
MQRDFPLPETELHAVSQDAFSARVAKLYPQLHQIAARVRRQFGSPQTLGPTALVSEVFVKLRTTEDWASDAHFLATVAVSVRHVLINHARERVAGKRGGADVVHLSIEDAPEIADDRQMLALNDALDDLAKLEPRLAVVVDYRYFGGYADAEIAEILAVSEKTVRRDWMKAKAILRSTLMA